MGAAAARLADKIILTSEDPRTEDPAHIAQEIMSGIPAKKRAIVSIELDRQKAISLAIKSAKPGDWVVACGKGHETSMNYNGFTETPWSDQDAFIQALGAK